MKPLRNSCLVRAVAMACIGLAVSASASATEVIVRARPMKWTPPDGGTPVVMWGYQVSSSENCPPAATSVASLPEWTPLVLVHNTDDHISIRLNNCLPVPTSLLVSGMTGNGGIGTRTESSAPLTRLVTLQAPASIPGEGPGSVAYELQALGPGGGDRRPGTYLLQSGTDPKVQVQMGLYGAIVIPYAGFGNFGGARDKLALFSEIDPALHPSTPAGTPVAANMRNYSPRYFLINGKAFTTTAAPLVSVGPGIDTGANPNNGKVLLRLLNAGFQDRAPQVLGGEFTVIGRDSRPVAVNRRMPQNTDLLGAGASLDVTFPRDASGAFPLYDRRLGLVNGAASGGGMRAKICITPNTGICAAP